MIEGNFFVSEYILHFSELVYSSFCDTIFDKRVYVVFSCTSPCRSVNYIG
jgi:hypothetical protein